MSPPCPRCPRSWQPSASVPAGSVQGRGSTRVCGDTCAGSGDTCGGSGGWGGARTSPRADGHSLMKRWRWPCQLSPRPWTNGCLTCLWGHKAERVSGPWGRGVHGGGALQPVGSPPPNPSPHPPPHLDADFFLALLQGVAAQHLHFGHHLGGGTMGVSGRWGGAQSRRGTPRTAGQHPP